MTAIHFELPANLSAEKLIAALNTKFDTHLASRQYLLKTYYDSFDWRLYRQGITCEFNHSKQSSTLLLSNRKNGQLIASTILFDVPSFTQQFNPGKIRQTLEPILECRALMAICTLECEMFHIDIINKDEKIVLRLMIEEFELLNNRITLYPVKGYDKICQQIVEFIKTDLGVINEDKPVLIGALKLHGRQPRDYSSKLDIKLTPELRADIACKYVFSHILRILKLNEQGTIADTDSEFLHDFRVAVRRTRVGLSQVKHVLPEEVLAKYKDFFSWLGQITGETRDLDVYLHNFEQYKKKLPGTIRQSINPLQHFLAAKKQKSHQQLAKKLRSTKYLSTLAEWEEFLVSTPVKMPTEADAKLSIKELADKRIWKAFKNVIKEGEAIDRHSSPQALHKLRKSCKKLRYLLEFFQHLYPQHQINKLIQRLKQLQDVLGDFQDYEVQQENLQKFCEEMQTVNTPNKTFLAMGVLIQDFENRKRKVKTEACLQFSNFKKSGNQNDFRTLFVASKK